MFFIQATDRTFLEKCHQQHGRNKYYEKPRVHGAEFGIYHYAGIVRYQVRLFLEILRDNIARFLVML